MKKWISLLCLLLLMGGCADNIKGDVGEGKQKVELCDLECEVADMSAFEEVEEDHMFLEATYEQTNQFYGDENFSGIIYYGRTKCPWCVEAVPILNSVAKKENKKIYYVDKGSEANKGDSKGEKEAIEILDAAYGLERSEEDGKPKLFVPEVVVVQNGEIVDHHVGTVKEHNAHERKMNKDERRLLKSIYKNLMNHLS